MVFVFAEDIEMDNNSTLVKANDKHPLFSDSPIKSKRTVAAYLDENIKDFLIKHSQESPKSYTQQTLEEFWIKKKAGVKIIFIKNTLYLPKDFCLNPKIKNKLELNEEKK